MQGVAAAAAAASGPSALVWQCIGRAAKHLPATFFKQRGKQKTQRAGLQQSKFQQELPVAYQAFFLYYKARVAVPEGSKDKQKASEHKAGGSAQRSSSGAFCNVRCAHLTIRKLRGQWGG